MFDLHSGIEIFSGTSGICIPVCGIDIVFFSVSSYPFWGIDLFWGEKQSRSEFSKETEKMSFRETVVRQGKFALQL